MEFCLPTGVLVGILALGFCVWALIKRWRQETFADSGLSVNDQLNHYEKMVANGLLDPQEFARIKDELAKRSSPPNPTSESTPSNDP